MKRTLTLILTLTLALAILLCLPVFASAAEPRVGINGMLIDMSEGYASGYGWEMVWNRRDDTYTLTLTSGSYDMITAYGDVCINVPAGSSVTIGKDTGKYALGVQDGTMVLNGTGSLSLIGENGLISLNGDIIVNGTAVSASGTKRGVYCSNGSLTLNGGIVNASGTNKGVETNGGLYVNGGTLNAVATDTGAADSAGIHVKDCYFKIADGSVMASGTNGIFTLQANLSVSGGSLTANGSQYGLYSGPETASSTSSGKTQLSVSSGEAAFTGAKVGVYLCNDSRFTLSGGTVQAKVSVGLDVSYTNGLSLEKSDFLMTGGTLKATGYNALSSSGLSTDANAERCKAFVVKGGFIDTMGAEAGLRCYNSSAEITDGVVNASATINSAVYMYYTDLLMSGGNLLAKGGAYGINCQSAHPQITGGEVYADGSSYGIFCMGQITMNGGDITAVGGNTGVAASTKSLIVGTDAASRVSLTAVGDQFAVSGAPVMMFGRTYTYTTDLNYKYLTIVDGENVYQSDTTASLKINGSPVDLVADMLASQVNIAYNPGGSAASYKWMLKKINGRYSLTLNGAALDGMEISGAMDIILNEAASSVNGEIAMENAIVRLVGNASSLAVTNNAGNAVSMRSSVLNLASGTLDLRAPLYAYSSDLFLHGTLYGNHRNETASLVSSDAVLMDAFVQNTDSTGMFSLNNSSLRAQSSIFVANGVSGTAFDAEDSTLYFENSALTTNGGVGLTAKKVTAIDSTLSVTGCVERAIAAGEQGLVFDNCTVIAQAQEEAIFTRGDAAFVSCDIRADSADGVRAILLTAAPDSLAKISVTGHSLIKSGKEPVRIADANGVASYFANEDVALSSVYISNDHNYAQTAAYIYCHTVGTAVMGCTYTDCASALTKVLPEAAHDFSVYVSNGDATCVSDGTKTATCPVCFAKDTVVDVNSKTAHSFTKFKTNNDATCLEDGTKTAVCDYCDTIETIPDVGSALGHDFEIVEVSGDCRNNVWTKMVCSRCKYETEPRDTGKLGTCKWDETRGCMRIRYCTVCGQTDNNILGHKYSDFASDNNVTCTTSGTLSAICARCGEKQSVEDPDNPPLGHREDKWVITQEPTAFATGIESLTCKNCPMKLESRVLPIVAVPLTENSGIEADNVNSILVLTSQFSVMELRKALENSSNCFIKRADGSAIEDDALCFTGLQLRITENGRLYSIAIPGDPTGDNKCDSADARIALRAAVGLETFTPAQIRAADVVADGDITSADARVLLRRSVGLPD